MSKIFAERGLTAAGKVLPKKEFRLFADSDWDLDECLKKYGPAFVEAAEKTLETPYAFLPASVYLDYVRNGNRSRFEELFFSRREMLNDFVMAELYEGKGRFLDRVIDGVWAIMEESTWILPAHIHQPQGLPTSFFSSAEGDDVKNIDLFSAATGGQMALIWYFTGRLLDEKTPIVRERLLNQLKLRILHPFYTYDHDWWMGADGSRRLNNWTPWIISNILTVIGLCEDDDERREFGVQKCMTILDRYTGPYPDDGGCDEGPGYWSVAGASLFDCAELLYDLTGGKIDVFDDPLLQKMCAYIMKVSIAKHKYVNFSDASSSGSPNARMIGRMGRRLGLPKLAQFASYLDVDPDRIALGHSSAYRAYRDLGEEVPPRSEFTPEHLIWFKDLQVAITNDENGLFFALKGGCNGESHNHNDVGQFILFDKGEPVIMDAGVERYTRDTFSEKRYTLWAMRASYHNIPEINGWEEQPGGKYRASVVCRDDMTGETALELKDAYPPQAGVVSYVRSGVLRDGVVTVKDTLKLAAPSPAVFHYLTTDKPECEGNKIRFAGGVTMEFDPSLRFSLTEVDLQKGKIAREWRRESLWRINLEAAPAAEMNFTTVLTK